jgi:molybdenum cofactor synthesis domain-containing protein
LNVSGIRLSILTISDGVSAGTRSDRSGAAINEWAQGRGYRVVAHEVVADRTDRIAATLIRWADSGDTDVVLTTGGTGLTERDVTPEATRAAIEREAPGLAEAMRSHGAASTPFAWLSRGVAGTRARTLILNLPGSVTGVLAGLETLTPLLEHAVQLLRGESTDRHDVHHG